MTFQYKQALLEIHRELCILGSLSLPKVNVFGDLRKCLTDVLGLQHPWSLDGFDKDIVKCITDI